MPSRSYSSPDWKRAKPGVLSKCNSTKSYVRTCVVEEPYNGAVGNLPSGFQLTDCLLEVDCSGPVEGPVHHHLNLGFRKRAINL